MGLSRFYEKYRADGWGASAHQPSMMVPLLLYAYCVGERSSRKIERACEIDVAFRAVAANRKPDHATTARFRRKNLGELEELFTQILRLCAEAGLVKLGVVAIDGTKVKANAALAANRTHSGLEKEVKRMLSEAEAKDEEEDRLYGEARGRAGEEDRGAPREGGGRGQEAHGTQAETARSDTRPAGEGERQRSREPDHEDAQGIRPRVQRACAP